MDSGVFLWSYCTLYKLPKFTNYCKVYLYVAVICGTQCKTRTAGFTTYFIYSAMSIAVDQFGKNNMSNDII